MPIITAAMVRRTLTVVIFATGEKVSKKSIPCVYPFATNRALYRSTFPSAWNFTLYTHLHPMADLF